MDNDILKQLNDQQCSVQWKSFLGVFAQELAEQLTVSNLRGLLQRSGTRFAAQYALPETDTVPALQEAMNAVWSKLNWGHVTLVEESTHLSITHHFSPLLPAFQKENLSWAPAFLEGVYEKWLHDSGADAPLHVTQAGAADVIGTLKFNFGR